MKEPNQDDALDAFWQSVQDGVHAEDELRLAAESSVCEDFLEEPCDEELSDNEIQRIVADATAPRDAAPILTRSRWGWSHLAAAGLLVVLLAAGVTVSIWQDGKNSNGGDGRKRVSFPRAALMLTDHLGTKKRRTAGLVRVRGSISFAVQECFGVLAKSTADEDATLRPVAKETLGKLMRILSGGSTVRGQHPIVPDLEVLVDRVLDRRIPADTRLTDLRVLAEDTFRAARCLVTADKSNEQWSKSLELTRGQLLKIVASSR